MFNWSKCKVISVVGNTGSGKTASCYNILNSIKDKSKYVVDHPFPQALDGTGVSNLQNINFEEVTDSVVSMSLN